MSSRDRRREFLAAVASELNCGRLARRRILNELSHHLDDCAAELRCTGLPPEEALDEAMRRLGDAETIGRVFRATRGERRTRRAGRALRSPAWIAVGAMTLVTMWAAELPPASGAKPTTTRPAIAHGSRCPARAAEPGLWTSGRHCGSRRP